MNQKEMYCNNEPWFFDEGDKADYEIAKDHFEGILKCIHEESAIGLYNHIEEVAAYFKTKVPFNWDEFLKLSLVC